MRYRRDVVFCARAIHRDLSAALGAGLAHGQREWDWWAVWHLADRLGGPFLLDPGISYRRGAYHRAGHIHVSPPLDQDELLQAVTHELVHRLASEPRWEPLNHCMDARTYNRDRFHEHVAKTVARMFARSRRDR